MITIEELSAYNRKLVDENLKLRKENENLKKRNSDEECLKRLAKKGYIKFCGKDNEWHYPSKGEYPNDFEDVLICFLTEDDAKDCVRGWYEYDFENDKHIFKYLNVLEIQCLKTVFAWKKLDLPELSKESE